MRYLMMSSYSYLGLIGDSRIEEAAKRCIEEFGTGTHGVRLLSGSTRVHRDLELTIARLKKSEDALVYSSGYTANLGTIAALCGPRDLVVLDKEDHASIIDGCRLSGAKMARFDHNDIGDLDATLSASASSHGICLVVVDGVYSMSGDIAPIPDIKKICERHGALLMVDEAHSLGLIGAKGLGIEDHFGSEDLVDIKMGTLSKAIPSVGGYVAGRSDLITFLKHAARPFIFSAALPPAQAAAAITALEILEAEPWRIEKVLHLGQHLRFSLKEAGFDIGLSQTGIIPLMTGSDVNAFNLAAAVREEGIIANPVVAPAVAMGRARLRVTVTAAHSQDDVDRARDAFVASAKRCRLL